MAYLDALERFEQYKESRIRESLECDDKAFFEAEFSSVNANKGYLAKK